MPITPEQLRDMVNEDFYNDYIEPLLNSDVRDEYLASIDATAQRAMVNQQAYRVYLEISRRATSGPHHRELNGLRWSGRINEDGEQDIWRQGVDDAQVENVSPYTQHRFVELQSDLRAATEVDTLAAHERNALSQEALQMQTMAANAYSRMGMSLPPPVPGGYAPTPVSPAQAQWNYGTGEDSVSPATDSSNGLFQVPLNRTYPTQLPSMGHQQAGHDESASAPVTGYRNPYADSASRYPASAGGSGNFDGNYPPQTNQPYAVSPIPAYAHQQAPQNAPQAPQNNGVGWTGYQASWGFPQAGSQDNGQGNGRGRGAR